MPATDTRKVRARLLTPAILAAIAGLAWPIGMAMGQPKTGGKPSTTSTTATQPAKPQTPAAAPRDTAYFDKILRRGASADWSLKVFVHLDSYQSINVQTPTTGPGAGNPNGQPPVTIIPFDFQTAALVFPVLGKTSTSEGATASSSAQIKLDGKSLPSTPTWLQDLPSGSRYGRWEMRDIKGRTIDFDVDLRCKSWELIFDETAASKVTWPTSGKWPSDAASSLGPRIEMGVDPGSAVVKAALDKWTAGKPPQSVAPVALAKFIAGRVLETVQPSGDGTMSSQTGLLQGFSLKGPDATLRDGRGSEHDIAALLCSLYRAAGLPARLVIGYDVSKSQGQGAGLGRQTAGDLRSWVEFCIIDDSAGGTPKQAWIPVDIVRQRHSSSRAPALDKPWKFFGNNDESDDVIPIAFHFHPPMDGAISFGSPCFWGWMTTPKMQTASQSIRFMASTPSRSAPPKPGGGGYK